MGLPDDAVFPRMKNSRNKGKVGELELSAYFREHGYHEARRGVQYSGGGDSPDVVGLPGFHVECKRTEQGNPYTFIAQAIRDSKGTDRVPVVFHRRNRCEWIVILRADDFLKLLPTPEPAPEEW